MSSFANKTDESIKPIHCHSRDGQRQSQQVKLTSSSEPETFGDFNQFQPAFINAHYLQNVLTY
jgi:hypothetical protein|tara:strand:- start:959 stop:1147 length:189 start_codon:yes stop_codon:yes gene_type:complete